MTTNIKNEPDYMLLVYMLFAAHHCQEEVAPDFTVNNVKKETAPQLFINQPLQELGLIIQCGNVLHVCGTALKQRVSVPGQGFQTGLLSDNQS